MLCAYGGTFTLNCSKQIDSTTVSCEHQHHPSGERRDGDQRMPIAAPACVSTLWNRATIPPLRALPCTTLDAPWRPPDCRLQVQRTLIQTT
jgi:hypothetical protein